MDKTRKGLGKPVKGVLFPVPPKSSELSESYSSMRDTIIDKIKQSRVRTVIHANSEMILLYWNIGKVILERQSAEGWGAKVIDRLSADLREMFPEMSGFSPRNLKYMRKFAENWTDYEIVQQVVAQIPWRSNITLLDKIPDISTRLWYAKQAIQEGWSSNVLYLMIGAQLIERKGKTVNNFPLALPPIESDMVNEVFKDPYLFDFIGTDMPRREVEVERELTKHIQDFLLELGQGFAFVGRQVHLEVGGDDFYLDLLFYHLKLRCYVVIELKACEFDPGFVAQLNMYQNVVNDVLKHESDNPTIGLLLVKGKNKTVVEYSLAGFKNPIGVADWQEKLGNEIPEELKSSLPTIEEIEKEIDA